MNSIEEFFNKDTIQDWDLTEMKGDIGGLLTLILIYCTSMRIRTYRFGTLSSLNNEIYDFLGKYRCRSKNFCKWVIDELFEGSRTLLEKILELRIQYPGIMAEKFYFAIEEYRKRTIRGRTRDNVYVLEMDIHGSGDLTNEKRALYGQIDSESYCYGVHVITGGFNLIKNIIKSEGGYIFSEEGDAILAVFTNIKDIVYAAYKLQTELREVKELEYRIGIGKGNLCVMHGRTRYSFSIVEAVRITSLIKNAGVLISQKCFCDLINYNYRRQCQNNRSNPGISKQELYNCDILNDPNEKWPIEIAIKQGISIKIMPRGLIQLKHTTHHVFEILINDKPWVIL